MVSADRAARVHDRPLGSSHLARRPIASPARLSVYAANCGTTVFSVRTARRRGVTGQATRIERFTVMARIRRAPDDDRPLVPIGRGTPRAGSMAPSTDIGDAGRGCGPWQGRDAAPHADAAGRAMLCPEAAGNSSLLRRST